MVHVSPLHVCVDRYESRLVDAATKRPLSPHYPPDSAVATKLFTEWDEKRQTVGSEEARAIPLPPLFDWPSVGKVTPVASNQKGILPSGYVSGVVAKAACAAASKRLCAHTEWLRACRGEQNRDYPYGDSYKDGTCNVFRKTHPAAALHDDPSRGHLDPRLHLVSDAQGPLLRPTGKSASCRSEWDGDAIYDMVGNLDEWVEDDRGKFVGGFFSRATKNGCAAVVGNHPNAYFDYSTGIRCCRDALP